MIHEHGTSPALEGDGARTRRVVGAYAAAIPRPLPNTEVKAARTMATGLP
jgi:hypothetical protein